LLVRMWSTALAGNFPSPALCGGGADAVVCSSSRGRRTTTSSVRFPSPSFGRRRRHPSSSSSVTTTTPRGLLVSPLSPLYWSSTSTTRNGSAAAKTARLPVPLHRVNALLPAGKRLMVVQPHQQQEQPKQPPGIAIVSSSSSKTGRDNSSREEQRRPRPAAVVGAAKMIAAVRVLPKPTVTVPALEIDTSKLNANDPQAATTTAVAPSCSPRRRRMRLGSSSGGGAHPNIDVNNDDESRDDDDNDDCGRFDRKEPLTPRSSTYRGQRNIPSPPPTPETVSCGSSSSSSSSSSSFSSSPTDGRTGNSPSRRHRRQTRTAGVTGPLSPAGPKTVRFSRVEIREHPRVLGDNPSVKKGPALSLGWYHDGSQRQTSFDIDTYEAIRAPVRCDTGKFAAMTSAARRKLLVREAGVSDLELQSARLEIYKIKRSRRHHNVILPYDDTVWVVESCLQTVQGLLQTGTGRRSSDWELTKLMEQAQRCAKEQKQQPQPSSSSSSTATTHRATAEI
jgi:hypothetical protein